MRPLTLFTLIFSCLISSQSFAQTPKQIEDDLLKSFKKIEYFSNKNDYDKVATVNDEFAKKLKSYTERSPATLTYPFNSMEKAGISIATSPDRLFRIYSWDTLTGGTMRYFINVIQYKSGDIIKAKIDRPEGADTVNNYHYTRIYSFQINGKVYYLARYLMIGSTKDVSDGIHVFTLQNGEPIDAKIIKTHSGFHSGISYEYDFGSVVNMDYDKRPIPRFDEKTNTIYLPMVDGNYQMTNKFIRYKFTDQYFERVKN